MQTKSGRLPELAPEPCRLAPAAQLGVCTGGHSSAISSGMQTVETSVAHTRPQFPSSCCGCTPHTSRSSILAVKPEHGTWEGARRVLVCEPRGRNVASGSFPEVP